MNLITTFFRNHKPLLFSLGGHGLIAVVFALSFTLSDEPVKKTNVNPVQARVISKKEMENFSKKFKNEEENKRRTKLARQEVEQKKIKQLQAKIKKKQQRLNQIKKQATRQKKLAKQQKLKQLKKEKNAKLLASKRKEQAKKLKAVKVAKANKLAKQKALADKKRQQLATQKRIAAQRKQAVANAKALKEKALIAEENKLRQEAIEKEQARIEAESRLLQKQERKRQLAIQNAKDEALQKELAEKQIKINRKLRQLSIQYIESIRQKITRNWRRPSKLSADVSCDLSVNQLPSGDVISVRSGECSGNALFKKSVEDAVWRASPLPLPPEIKLFDRNIQLTFKPK